MKTTYKCTKCCNFGPGDPCIIQMDKDCPAPTFCPSDDGKYPGADWNEISQQAVEADAGNFTNHAGRYQTTPLNLIVRRRSIWIVNIKGLN